MPKPVLQSLILADHVYEDKLTGKRIIAGVFNRIIRGVRVLKQMGPPMPVIPQQPVPYNPPPAVPTYIPPPPAPAAQPGFAPQTPAPQVPAQQPGVADPYSAPQPAAPPSQPAPPPSASPPPPPDYAAQNPAAPSIPAAPAPAAPPSQPAQPNYRDLYEQPSQVVQPGQPLPVPVPTPPAPPPYTPPPPAHVQPPHIGPPGSPLQPGQRVLEIPPTGLQSGSPFAYLSLTEIRGPNAFILELVNLSDESQLFRSDLRVDCPDPLLTVEMTVPLPPIAPPQAGIYALQLLHNNEILGSLRIIVEDAAQ